MTENFAGQWFYAGSENLEEYLKKIGVCFLRRKIATKLKPLLEFVIDPTHKYWSMLYISALKSYVIDFELGKEFIARTPDGRKVKCVFYLDGDKLIQVEKKLERKGKDARIVRYLKGNNKLVVEIECEGIHAKLFYVREQE